MSTLVEDHYSFLIVEHNPLLYEDAWEIMELLSRSINQTCREATVQLYASARDRHLQMMAERANLGVLRL